MPDRLVYKTGEGDFTSRAGESVFVPNYEDHLQLQNIPDRTALYIVGSGLPTDSEIRNSEGLLINPQVMRSDYGEKHSEPVSGSIIKDGDDYYYLHTGSTPSEIHHGNPYSRNGDIYAKSSISQGQIARLPMGSSIAVTPRLSRLTASEITELDIDERWLNFHARLHVHHDISRKDTTHGHHFFKDRAVLMSLGLEQGTDIPGILGKRLGIYKNEEGIICLTTFPDTAYSQALYASTVHTSMQDTERLTPEEVLSNPKKLKLPEDFDPARHTPRIIAGIYGAIDRTRKSS
jgi:hypothetical protein